MEVIGARTTAPRQALIPATVSASCSLGGKQQGYSERLVNAAFAAAPKNNVGEDAAGATPGVDGNGSCQLGRQY